MSGDQIVTTLTPTLGASEESPSSPSLDKPPAARPAQGSRVSDRFFEFTGRTSVWKAGLKMLKDSPLFGFGFQSDRLLFGTHMHNSLMQALIQTGILGTIPLVASILLGWSLFFRIIRNLNQLPIAHKHLAIQTGAILAFFTMRSFPESTGAFFGVDWLILACILLYLHLLNQNSPIGKPSLE